jgi:hypothetical protein
MRDVSKAGTTVKGQINNRRAVIFELALKYGWVCWYCNLPLQPENSSFVFRKSGVVSFAMSTNVHTHVDHIVPKSRGGTDDINNLALACEFCNRAKLDMDVETYLTWLDRVRFGDTWSPIRDGAKSSNQPNVEDRLAA